MKKKPDLRVYSHLFLKKLLMKIKLALLIVFIAISFSPKAFADFYMNIADDELQQKQVTGTVTDAGGNPLPGVSVVVKGTTLGTLTDAAGKYTLTNIPQSATLVFSFIGMATKEIPASDRSQIDIIMSEEAIGLDEVIVIGYGTAKKK
jgi:hypothetical protein